jgi:hypothetical protein
MLGSIVSQLSRFLRENPVALRFTRDNGHVKQLRVRSVLKHDPKSVKDETHLQKV